MRPVNVREKNISGSAVGVNSSPMISPMNRHRRSGSIGLKKPQNNATKAAAQRLAQVMSHQSPDDDEDHDDDLSLDYTPVIATGSVARTTGRTAVRPHSPKVSVFWFDMLETTTYKRNVVNWKAFCLISAQGERIVFLIPLYIVWVLRGT